MIDNSRPDNSRFIAELWRSIGPYRKTLIFGLVCAAIAGGFDALGPWLLKKGVDSLQAHLDIKWLYIFSGLIVFTSAVGGWFRFIMRDKVIGVSRFVECDIRDRFFKHLLKLAPAFFDHNHTGDLMARATEDVERVRMVLGPALLYAINTVLTMLFSAAMMFTLDRVLASWIMILSPLVGAVVFWVARTLHRANLRQQEVYGELSNCVQENLTGIRVVKAFAREANESERFAQVCKAYFERSMDVVKVQSLFFPILALLIGLGTAGILWLGANRIAAGAMTFGSFVAFMGYLSLMTWPMIALGWITHLYQRGAASHNRLHTVFNTQPQFPEIAAHLSDGNGQTSESTGSIPPEWGRSAPEIVIRNLTLRYRSEGRPALRNINMTIPAGATAAVVGRVGSGKSSLARALVRLYQPETGEILLNGVHWGKLSPDVLRRAVGYVDQTPFLFSTTIRENITLGDGAASEDDIWRAAYAAAFDEVIRAYPDGLATRIGERGVTLSGGQQQRLTLARALVSDPPLLILDDALSAVDADTEAEILKRLASRLSGRTTIFITHRMAAAENADLIIVLDEGTVVEVGSHFELLSRGTLYAAMYRRQRLAEELRGLS